MINPMPENIKIACKPVADIKPKGTTRELITPNFKDCPTAKAEFGPGKTKIEPKVKIKRNNVAKSII